MSTQKHEGSCELSITWVECGRDDCDCGGFIYKIIWCQNCLGIVDVDDEGLKKDLMKEYQEIVMARKSKKPKAIDLPIALSMLSLRFIKTIVID